MSVYHRVDDLEGMAADRFWCFAERLPHYGGALAASVRRVVTDEPVDEPPPVAAPGTKVLVGPEQAAAMLAQPLYGDIPGLGPAFSYSFAPLAPDPEGDSGG